MPMYCTGCGVAIEPDSRFCTNCGQANLHVRDAPEPGPAPVGGFGPTGAVPQRTDHPTAGAVTTIGTRQVVQPGC